MTDYEKMYDKSKKLAEHIALAFPDVPDKQHELLVGNITQDILSTLKQVSEERARSLREALEPIRQAVDRDYHEDDWNPNCHAEPITLTVAEVRAMLAAITQDKER